MLIKISRARGPFPLPCAVSWAPSNTAEIFTAEWYAPHCKQESGDWDVSTPPPTFRKREGALVPPLRREVLLRDDQHTQIGVSAAGLRYGPCDVERVNAHALCRWKILSRALTGEETISQGNERQGKYHYSTVALVDAQLIPHLTLLPYCMPGS